MIFFFVFLGEITYILLIVGYVFIFISSVTYLLGSLCCTSDTQNFKFVTYILGPIGTLIYVSAIVYYDQKVRSYKGERETFLLLESENISI